MTTRAVAEIDDWDTVPFGGGYAGLRELADAGFSGVVQAGPAKLCLLNGTPVGVLDGSIEDFEDAAGTAYEAPSPALPLLALMQARGDEVRAEYYSEDTPISEVDRTLSEGGFSGYVELSENVLSGDYYVVYHAGRSMAVAWVGNVGELLTDDEAFQRADDEVGIYQVRQVDIEPVEIPGSAGGSSAGAAGTGAGAGSAGDTGAAATDTESSTERAGAAESGEPPGTAGTDEPDAAEPESGSEPESTVTAASTTETASAQPAEDGTAETADSGSAEISASSTRTEADTVETGRTDTPEPAESTASAETVESSGTDRVRERDSASQRPSAGADEAPGERADEESTDGRDDAGGATAAPAERLETRSIPSLDPARTSDGRETDAAAAGGGAATGAAGDTGGAAGDGSTERSSADESRSADDTQPQSASRPQSEAETDSRLEPTDDAASEPTEPGTANDQSGPRATDDRSESSVADGVASDSDQSSTGTSPEASSERVAALEAEIEEREAKRERLESELATVRSERDDLQRERDELREARDTLQTERDRLATERDELAAEVDRLEAESERLRSELDELKAEFGGALDSERQLSPSEALTGTNLFVRYESKGKATLESAHGGNANREDVAENLDLEHHTQFEAANVSVNGQPFEAFLRETLQYRFVDWVVEDLVYEIRDTGKVAALQDLYDAIPNVDRAELGGTVTVEFTEDGQEKEAEESFDVVLRDRMGTPLVVANLSDSRDAVTEGMMRSLVTASSRVSESDGSLAAAIYITSSFFEPEALETAAASTGHGRFSRDKRESFVKHSRNRGYHLCLAEARDSQFHLTVPDL